MSQNSFGLLGSGSPIGSQLRMNHFRVQGLLASPDDSAVPQTPRIRHTLTEDQSVPRTPVTRSQSTQDSPWTPLDSGQINHPTHNQLPWESTSPYFTQLVNDQLVPSTPMGTVQRTIWTHDERNSTESPSNYFGEECVEDPSTDPEVQDLTGSGKSAEDEVNKTFQEEKEKAVCHDSLENNNCTAKPGSRRRCLFNDQSRSPYQCSLRNNENSRKSLLQRAVNNLKEEYNSLRCSSSVQSPLASEQPQMSPGITTVQMFSPCATDQSSSSATISNMSTSHFNDSSFPSFSTSSDALSTTTTETSFVDSTYKNESPEKGTKSQCQSSVRRIKIPVSGIDAEISKQSTSEVQMNMTSDVLLTDLACEVMDTTDILSTAEWTSDKVNENMEQNHFMEDAADLTDLKSRSITFQNNFNNSEEKMDSGSRSHFPTAEGQKNSRCTEPANGEPDKSILKENNECTMTKPCISPVMGKPKEDLLIITHRSRTNTPIRYKTFSLRGQDTPLQKEQHLINKRYSNSGASRPRSADQKRGLSNTIRDTERIHECPGHFTTQIANRTISSKEHFVLNQCTSTSAGCGTVSLSEVGDKKDYVKSMEDFDKISPISKSSFSEDAGDVDINILRKGPASQQNKKLTFPCQLNSKGDSTEIPVKVKPPGTKSKKLALRTSGIQVFEYTCPNSGIAKHSDTLSEMHDAPSGSISACCNDGSGRTLGPTVTGQSSTAAMSQLQIAQFSPLKPSDQLELFDGDDIFG